MKILIVDDEKLIRDVIKTYAEEENYECLKHMLKKKIMNV